MGFYDTVHVTSPLFVCSEGHDMRGEQFQTKDLGETMGHATIGTKLELDLGDWNAPVASLFTGTIDIYTSCRQCPAFVQAKTWNVLDAWVEFEVTIAADVVTNVWRRSPSTAEWIASKPTTPYMADAYGPMPHAEAQEAHIEALRGYRVDLATEDKTAAELGLHYRCKRCCKRTSCPIWCGKCTITHPLYPRFIFWAAAIDPFYAALGEEWREYFGRWPKDDVCTARRPA